MARVCEHLARDARRKPDIRRQYLSFAVRWRELAEKFDELERRAARSSDAALPINPEL